MKTSITFNPPSQLPDADQDVLASVLLKDGSIEVWEAHYEDGAWLTSNATLIQPPCEVVSWADKPEGVDLRNGTACNQIMASQAETKLREALQALLASGGEIAEATDDELQAAIDDPDAEEIVKVQAAAVLNARQALAATEQAAPAVPRGIPAQEVIDAIEAWKSAWLKVPPFADRVNKATREAITISHNSLFLLLQSAQQAQRMPAGCATPTGCGPHGCHGACIAAAPAALREKGQAR